MKPHILEAVWHYDYPAQWEKFRNVSTPYRLGLIFHLRRPHDKIFEWLHLNIQGSLKVIQESVSILPVIESIYFSLYYSFVETRSASLHPSIYDSDGHLVLGMIQNWRLYIIEKFQSEPEHFTNDLFRAKCAPVILSTPIVMASLS